MYIERFGNLATNTDGTELLLITLSFVALMCVVMLKGEIPKSVP
jgi:S-adenosylmethionine hydrolase